MPARARASEQSQYNSWDRARLSVVVPIGVIVAVAIVCIVVAVLSSARRADEVAIAHEQQLLSRALDNFGERVLRQVESVASSPSAIQNIRVKFDAVWAEQRVGIWLQTYFDHDYVFIFDAQDRPIYSLVGRGAAAPAWFAAAWPDMKTVIDSMRGRDSTLAGAVRLDEARQPAADAHEKAAVIRRFLGRPAVIAAVAVGPIGASSAPAGARRS